MKENKHIFMNCLNKNKHIFMNCCQEHKNENYCPKCGNEIKKINIDDYRSAFSDRIGYFGLGLHNFDQKDINDMTFGDCQQKAPTKIKKDNIDDHYFDYCENKCQLKPLKFHLDYTNIFSDLGDVNNPNEKFVCLIGNIYLESDTKELDRHSFLLMANLNILTLKEYIDKIGYKYDSIEKAYKDFDDAYFNGKKNNMVYYIFDENFKNDITCPIFIDDFEIDKACRFNINKFADQETINKIRDLSQNIREIKKEEIDDLLKSLNIRVI